MSRLYSSSNASSSCKTSSGRPAFSSPGSVELPRPISPAWREQPDFDEFHKKDFAKTRVFEPQEFIEHARHFDPPFIELGAIRVIEGWGDDVPDGKVTHFRRAGPGHGRGNGGGFEQVVEVKA